MTVIFGCKSYLPIVDAFYAVVADGNLMGVTPKVFYHLLRSEEGAFAVNYPILCE